MSVYTLASKSSPVAPYSIHFHLFSPSLFFPHYFLLCILYLPFQFIILYYVVAHTLLQISPLLLFFFLFGVYIFYSLPCCLCLPSVILFVWVKWFCGFLSLSFSFIHSYSFSRLVSVCLCLPVCTHGWRSSGFQTDVQWQHLKRASDLGQWATHFSCIHLH